MAHTTRPEHSRNHPVLITLRMAKDAPNLRKPRVFRVIREAFALGRDQAGFRLTHYAVHSDLIYLIVEAEDQDSLSRGMQGLSIRIARGVNGVSGRTGRLWAERYESKSLRSAQEVRQALVTVLRNSEPVRGGRRASWNLDECSSALEFDGFKLDSGAPPLQLVERETTVAPLYSALLRSGWKRQGLLAPSEFTA